MNYTVYRLRPVAEHQWEVDLKAQVAEVSARGSELEVRCQDPILARLIRGVFSEPALRKVGLDCLESYSSGSPEADQAYQEELFALGLGFKGPPVKSSAAYKQYESLIKAIQEQPERHKLLLPLWSQLTDYLRLEGVRFCRYAEIFEDPETCGEFERLAGLLGEFRTLVHSASAGEDLDKLASLLEQAKQIDYDICQSCDFLLN